MKRKPGQPHRGWKAAVRKSLQRKSSDVVKCAFPNCDCDLSNNGRHRCPKQEKFK